MRARLVMTRVVRDFPLPRRRTASSILRVVTVSKSPVPDPPSRRHHPSPKSLKRVALHSNNNSIKRHLLVLQIMRRTPRRKTAQRRQSVQVIQVQMRAPPNLNTLHQQVRHPHRPHHSCHHIGANNVLPRIRRVPSRYQRWRPRPSAN